VRALAYAPGAPERLVWKVPTADLESDAPLRPDEEVYGVTYDKIDDFLKGKAIDPTAGTPSKRPASTAIQRQR
jgi:NAD+ synthase